MYVVEDHRHAVARRLGQANIPRNDALENLGAEERAQVGGDLLGKRGAVVVHREKNALDGERWIDGAAETGQRVEKLGHALESQKLALNGHKDRVGGGQGVDGEDIERWRAIDEDEIVFFAQGLNGLLEPVLAIVHGDQFDGGTDEVLVGRDEIGPVDLPIDDYAIDGLSEDQGLV